MSDYTVISAVSNTLLQVLKQNITMSPDAGLNGVDISLLSPPEMHETNSQSGISVWLYKVSRMSEMLNDPPERRGVSQILRTPLPIILFYLITPISADPDTRHILLGRVLQVLNDHAILRGADLQGVLENTSEQLRVNLEALSLEELSLVWEALSEPYQLSVTYLVQVVKIDSDLEPVQSSLVVEKTATYSQILATK
jgi:hypothetical protein